MLPQRRAAMRSVPACKQEGRSDETSDGKGERR